jgi:hypothetical protein
MHLGFTLDGGFGLAWVCSVPFLAFMIGATIAVLRRYRRGR